ncbi:DUF1653 domain-containing protein [Candidatus Nomurabacteria bacterium]|uniref:DUF1653 domain-containing protein n=1 Tax=Candidatus Dojkabacteria bacterium TaxID=2099670 RepID=A0A955HZL7_9BACT|nr:DUF1653 domain-containing protein [Candidatus Dojkabacteria bacterium]MCB9789711.1 DUF1653 domain-containing protein [Candidatus Nomurabacteria bacterium]MCB9803941.1 DUF1653 domain-containing protein [Candidatus Nomurabacteria bacterium]
MHTETEEIYRILYEGAPVKKNNGKRTADKDIHPVVEYTGVAFDVPEGRWRHFKGGEYYVYGACEDGDGESYILYRHLDGKGQKKLWLRPKEMFLGIKQLENGDLVERFVYLGS